MFRGLTRGVIRHLAGERNHAVFGGHVHVRRFQRWLRVEARLDVRQDGVVVCTKKIGIGRSARWLAKLDALAREPGF